MLVTNFKETPKDLKSNIQLLFYTNKTVGEWGKKRRKEGIKSIRLIEVREEE